MNGSSPTTTRESSPVSSSKESSPHKSLKLKRSSPVLTKKLSSPFPYAKKMESPKKTEPAQTNTQTTNEGIMFVPTKDVCSPSDILLTSEMKLNRKRSSLSKRLSSSADNVLSIEDNVSQSCNPLSSKEKASRSKSTENLSVIHKRGGSTKRKNRLSIGSPKSPYVHDGNKLISLAQGILTNLRIPGFGKQHSGSEPPLRSSWCLKVYDGTNELENYTKDLYSAETEESSKKVDQQMVNDGDRNSKLLLSLYH